MVRLGSFVDKEEAEEIKTRLKGNGYNAVVKTRKHLVLGRFTLFSFNRSAALPGPPN